MADQTFGEVTNTIVVDPGKLPLLSVVVEGTTSWPGCVVKEGSSGFPQVAVCDEANEPCGVLDCPATHDLDTNFADGQETEMASVGSNAIVYVKAAAAAGPPSWNFGDKIMSSQTADDDGKVIKSTAVDGSETLYLIGIAQQSLTASATDDKVGRIRLST